MASIDRTSDNLHSNGSKLSDLTNLNNWLTSSKDSKQRSTLKQNPKLNAEIHSAITEESSKYVSLICDHLFTLYHDVPQRPFVFQFLPSFVTAYYDVLYHHHPQSVDATTKDVCSTIDTFLVSLYNLGVIDDGSNGKVQEFRMPNLSQPSIYHTPNPDHYTPAPLTQHTISKHERTGEVIRTQVFTPLDTVTGTTRDQILWFLLIQYGANVSLMDKHSRQSYLQMANKLLGQGFAFNSDMPIKNKSRLPPSGRRIHVSSRMMSEMLGTLFYFKSNSTDSNADDCMRLLKKRAEYELYADVILMTESMGYLHEFESQRPQKPDTIGIEIESPATIDVIRQKRTATTTRSMKNRHRSSKQHQTTDHDENNVHIISSTPQQQRPILTVVDANSSAVDYQTSKKNTDLPFSPMIDEARSNISSSIGPATSTPSPSSTRHYASVSFTSAGHFSPKTLQGKETDSLPLLPMRTLLNNHEDRQSSPIVAQIYTSRLRHGEEKDMIPTVRFVSEAFDQNLSNIEQTYL